MKKLSFVLMLVTGIFQHSIAQNKWENYSQTYPSGFNRDSTEVGIVANTEERNDDFWSITDNDALEKDVLADPGFQTAPLNNFVFITTFSNTPVYFFIKNVNTKNAGEYEYRVSRDKHEVIVPWSQVKRFDTPGFGAGAGRDGVMGYIGGYTAAPGHQIVVDLRRKGTGNLTSTAVVLWQAVKPAVTDIYTANDLNKFLNHLTHAWINKNERPAGMARDGKPTFKSTENNLIFCLQASITNRAQIEYEVIKDDKTYIPWKKNDFDNAFIWLKSLPHGSYRLKIRYTVQPDHVTSYDFVINPAWYQTTAIKITAGTLMIAFLGLIIWLNILIIQRRKAKNEIAKKDRLQMELQIIRSQLNPHFIFNALTSIQGLVNKKDVLGANTYLSEFAQLLRNTLINNNREQVALAVELKILDTYLKLEQLRFNFIYEITVDEAININETEIPSLLLQPLLENAIVHGVGDLKENGRLTLNFAMQQKDMVIRVTDNGKGFDASLATAGYGLKLTRERIQLLNNILNDGKIMLEIASNAISSTIITLTFSNWFNEN